MTALAELVADSAVEGVYAVSRKERLRTRAGASYLALELTDESGRAEARVWNDVDLLDGRFSEGEAVRVLGRVESFRDKLQIQVRTLEPAPEADPSTLAPAGRRDPDELEGFLDFLVAEIAHEGLRATVTALVADGERRRRLRTLPATRGGHHSYSGGLLEHTVGVATICRDLCQLHPRLRSDLLLSAALTHDLGRTLELGPAPLYAPTGEGRLLGHVQLGLRLIEQHAGSLSQDLQAELLHAVATHHEARAARTAEAAALYHANQLDTVAQLRPVDSE
ncbi:MAG TPA: HD domain-containing protein [Gaiellaceae bacterium]